MDSLASTAVTSLTPLPVARGASRRSRPVVDESPHYRPLYRQVYEALLRQIADGAWRPGEALPSEQALAGKLGVSQGTVRKALDTLAVEKLIERRQGKGTYIAEHTQERTLFRFFRLTLPDGSRAIPASEVETVRRRGARGPDVRHLGVAVGAPVVEINRTRLIEGVPAILERIVLPGALFPDIERRAPLPNALYTMYQHQYGQNIVTAEEQLSADVAGKEDARRLGLPVGTPLLHIERIAIGVDGMRVEWRVSRCDTRRLRYAVTLS
jgi:GntR family transcriptional regulator